MVLPKFAQNIVRIAGLVDVSSSNPIAVGGDQFIYEYVSHVSGPAGTDDTNMNPDADLADSIFEYVVPPGPSARVARLNLAIVDPTPRLDRFGGQPALAEGVVIQALDANDNELEDLTAGRPIMTNAAFLYLAGVDMELDQTAGAGVVKVRVSLFKAGANMLLLPGEKIRFTIQDDLSALGTEFRCMVQGMLTQ